MKLISDLLADGERLRLAVAGVGALGFLVAISRLAISAGVPTLWSPYPMGQFLLLSNNAPKWLCLAAVAGTFFVLLAIAVWIPNGRLWLACVLGALTLSSVLYFVLRARAGLNHQGMLYVATMIFANALAICVLWAQWYSLPHRGVRVLLVPLSLSLWLFWFAFPFLGEGI